MGEKLRVMLVDGRLARSTAVIEGLEQAGCHVVHRASPSSDLEAAIMQFAPEVIIIDLESPDRDTLEGMRRIGIDHPRPVVMFVDDSDADSIRSAIQAGVGAYVVKGASPERVRPVLDVAIARFHEHQALKNELRQVRSTLEERKVIERAKGVLMEKRQISEEEAYGSLRKTAMNRKMKLAEVAQRVVEMADLL